MTLVSVRQVHGNRVAVLEDSGTAGDPWLLERDAIVTRIPGYALAVFTADCLPILLFDPIHKAIGVVHAGWRGTAAGVARRALEKMVANFGSHPGEIEAALGPGIGPCCLEVDTPVQEAFQKNTLSWTEIAAPKGAGKWSLDLYGANTMILASLGIEREKIHLLDLCTCCRSDLFSSYRGERGTRGRQVNYIGLKRGWLV